MPISAYFCLLFQKKVIDIQEIKREIAAKAFSDEQRKRAADGTNYLQVGSASSDFYLP